MYIQIRELIDVTRRRLSKLVNVLAPLKAHYIIILAQLYLLFSYGLYIFGPFNYEQESPYVVLLLVLSYQAAMMAGYIWASRRNKPRKYLAIKHILPPSAPPSNSNIIFIICSLSLGIVLVTLQTIFLLAPSSFIDLLLMATNNITNPGLAYSMTIENSQRIEGSPLSYLLTILSPLFYIAFTWGIYWFTKLPVYARVIAIIYGVFILAQSLITGQNIGIFQTFVIIATVFITSQNITSPNVSKRGTTKPYCKRKYISGLIVATLATITILTYFGTTMHKRNDSPNPISSFSGVTVTKDHWMLNVIPEPLHTPFIMGNVYLSSGYKALDYSISYPFESTYGFGNGYFAINVAEKLGIKDQYSRTYVSKMSDKWHPTINWHTAYVWYANDVSLYGIPILMFLLGLGLAHSIAAVRDNNKYAISLLPLLIMVIFFIPANNYVLGNPMTATTFVATLLLFVTPKAWKNYIKKTIIRRKRT